MKHEGPTCHGVDLRFHRLPDLAPVPNGAIYLNGPAFRSVPVGVGAATHSGLRATGVVVYLALLLEIRQILSSYTGSSIGFGGVYHWSGL